MCFATGHAKWPEVVVAICFVSMYEVSKDGLTCGISKDGLVISVSVCALYQTCMNEAIKEACMNEARGGIKFIRSKNLCSYACSLSDAYLTPI